MTTPDRPTPASPSASGTAQPPNRLGRESSPYLRQHMYNPVDWWPWGDEAFAEARRRGVPVFLSVGYSTCYWCHVMERECFENPAIATLMNEHLVCIKVDREERPDVDDIYMAAVQLFSQGRGGWPMSVWLTPPGARGADDRGLEPFYAGTYFPPTADPRYGRPSFPQLIQSIAEHWATDRAQVLEQASQATGAICEQLETESEPVSLSAGHVGEAVSMLLRLHDAVDGGFGQAPKFPQPVFLEFLLDVIPHLSDPAVQSTATRAVRRTLDRMALGGMYDQVGGGFHRYSVDGQWRVPHFEKMLYDNGQLASVYARSYRLTRDPLDGRVLAETLEYVRREMTDPSTGAFFSAQDAEVNHREGQNYLWTPDEIRAALPPDEAALALKLYGLDQGPNFRDPHHPGDGPRNVLFMPAREEELARAMGVDVGTLLQHRAEINERLREVRARRDQPTTDDKIIAAWNGLMIAGMADGAAAIGDVTCYEAAERAASHVLGSMIDGSGGLLRTGTAAARSVPGFLEDYAMMALGCTALCKAGVGLGRDIREHLRHAVALARAALDRFGERHTLIDGAEPKAYTLVYDTLPDRPDLLVRHRGAYDGAMPSGASVLLHALLDLHELTRDEAFVSDARRLIVGLSAMIGGTPLACVNSTRALHRLANIDPTIVRPSGAPTSTDDGDKQAGPVRVFASTDRVAVAPGAPSVLMLKLEIEDGYHIIAAAPVPAGAPEDHVRVLSSLTPLSVRIEGGSGLAVRAVYPAAEVFRGGAGPEVLVHAGDVEIELVLTRTDDRWNGRPILTVGFQACTDRACERATIVELDVAIDPA